MHFKVDNHKVPLEKIYYNNDLFFVLLLFSFFLLGILKSYYWNYTKLILKGVFFQRYANQYLREENALTERVDFLTFIIMALNFSLLIAFFENNISSSKLALIFICTILFFAIKALVVRLLGFLFFAKDLSRLAVFFSFIFERSLAIILLPLIVILYYFSFDISGVLSLVIFSIILIFFAVKFFQLKKIGRSIFGLSNFYIFLYLCGLEILPLLIIAKKLGYY